MALTAMIVLELAKADTAATFRSPRWEKRGDIAILRSAATATAADEAGEAEERHRTRGRNLRHEDAGERGRVTRPEREAERDLE